MSVLGECVVQLLTASCPVSDPAADAGLPILCDCSALAESRPLDARLHGA